MFKTCVRKYFVLVSPAYTCSCVYSSRLYIPVYKTFHLKFSKPAMIKCLQAGF